MSTYNTEKSFEEFANEILKIEQEKQSAEEDKVISHIRNVAVKTTLGILKKYHQTYIQKS